MSIYLTETEPGVCEFCGKAVKDLDEHFLGPCPKTAKFYCARCGFKWWYRTLELAEEAEERHGRCR